jgi:hypothetical protein
MVSTKSPVNFKVVNIDYCEENVTLQCKPLLTPVWVGKFAVENFLAVKFSWHKIMPKLYNHLIIGGNNEYTYTFTQEDILYNKLTTELEIIYLDEDTKPIYPIPGDKLYFSIREWGNKRTKDLISTLNLYAYQLLCMEHLFEDEI